MREIPEFNSRDTHEFDPLSGIGQPTSYRLDSIVFAEPITVPRDLDTIEEELTTSPHYAYTDHVAPKIKKTKLRVKSSTKQEHSEAFSGTESKIAAADGQRFCCEVCDKSFPQRYLLRRHVQAHQAATHTCPTCHKRLSVRTQLAVHMRSHSPARRFTCARCGRGFTRRAGLAKHARFLHPSSGSLACLICGERFVRRAELQRHETTAHAPERRLACEACGRMFSTLGALAAHAAKTHRGQKDTVKPKPVTIAGAKVSPPEGKPR